MANFVEFEYSIRAQDAQKNIFSLELDIYILWRSNRTCVHIYINFNLHI